MTQTIMLQPAAPQAADEILAAAVRLCQAKTVADPKLLTALKSALTKWNSTTKKWS